MNAENALLIAVSAALRGEKAELSLSNDAWRQLIRTAEEQKLLPLVFDAAGGSMPEELFPSVRTRVRHTVANQLRSEAEFKKLLRELYGLGIRPLLVKGLLCRRTYPKPDLRVSSDEDLYIRSDYPDFHAAMLSLGFEASDPDYENAHEERCTRNGLLVEGHWELFPQENSALNALNSLSDGFWSRAEERDIDGIPVLCLEPTDHMSFLLLHAYKHFVSSGVGIRQICDIAQWAKAYDIGWQRVYELMLSVHVQGFCAGVFDAAEKHFGMAFPEVFPRLDGDDLVRDALLGGIYGSADMNRKHSGSMTLAALEATNGGAAAPLKSAVFPSRAVMEMSFPWVKKSALLLPAAWGVRIVRYLRRGSLSAAESIRIGNERIELLKKYGILRNDREKAES